MNDFRELLGEYGTDLHIASVRASRVAWIVALGWVLMPFGLATLVHPEDMINAQYILQGETPPHVLTAQQMGVGFVETLFALAVFVLVQLVGTVLFYRFAQITDRERIATPVLWPLAALLPGVIGNAIWFCALGYADVTGLVIGLVPIAMTFGCERLCEHLGHGFVFGRAVSGAHPPVQPW
jgi:hypothetical protein